MLKEFKELLAEKGDADISAQTLAGEYRTFLQEEIAKYQNNLYADVAEVQDLAIGSLYAFYTQHTSSCQACNEITIKLREAIVQGRKKAAARLERQRVQKQDEYIRNYLQQAGLLIFRSVLQEVK